MQQQHARSGRIPSFKHVDAQTVDVGHEARADAGWQGAAVEWAEFGHRDFSYALARSNAASVRSCRTARPSSYSAIPYSCAAVLSRGGT